MIRKAVIVFFFLLTLPSATFADDFNIIDTQAQFDPKASSDAFPGGTEEVIRYMDDNGVAMTLIVPPPFPEDVKNKYDFEEILPAIKGHRDRFGFLAGGGSLSPMILSTPPDKVTEDIKQRFKERAAAIIEAGALGFGEVTASHLSVPAQMGEEHRYSGTVPDHPLLLLLADLAAEYDVPVDLHFEIFPRTMDTPRRLQSSRNPKVLNENLQAFERLLAHNRDAKISWAHMGSDPAFTREPSLIRSLLERHPNLYGGIRLAFKKPAPVFALKPDGTLKPDWRKLFMEFPDRFTVHSDAFYYPGRGIVRGSSQSIQNLNEMLEQLPLPLARKLAYENAESLYRIEQRN
ncbi:MAG: hypothetical protein ACQERR_09520 [Pseudomonadota bacterium]